MPNSKNTYNSINNQIWGDGGSGYEGYQTQIDKETAYQQQYGTGSNPYTNDEMEEILKNLGINESIHDYSQYGGYVKDGSSGLRPGTGEEGWGYYEGTPRPVANGSSGADEQFMGDGDYAYIQYCKQMYAQAQENGDREAMDRWHQEAERVRARAGYSGGADGSMYIPLAQVGVTGNAGGSNFRPEGLANGATGSSDNTQGTGSDLQALLNAWQDAALKQSNGQIDYAVQKAVTDLERALADAQPMFKEQAETVAREERQALDNSALYAEMRGDKGGIGQEQYNSIQNTAAQNHLTVQQAQTKLATDTQRQIADLRAQGEFEKADAALQITQQYLQQLISLEQWAKEYNLSVDQFNESVRQWEAEYNMAMQQLQISQNQWQAEFAFQQQQYQNSLNQWQQEFDYNKQSDMANIGWALLESGIPLSEEQMSAMGIDPKQASQILMQQQLEAALKNNKGGTPAAVTQDYDTLFAKARESGNPQSYIANNYKKYGFTSNTGLYNDYKNWIEGVEADEAEPGLEDLDMVSVMNLNMGMLSYEEIERMVQMGALEMDDSGNKIAVRWAKDWNAARYNALKNNPFANGALSGGL